MCHGIQRIESLSESDPEVDALLSDLKRRLSKSADEHLGGIHTEPVTTKKPELSDADIQRIADVVAAKVLALLNTKLE